MPRATAARFLPRLAGSTGRDDGDGAAPLPAGCDTVEGAGQDPGAAGRAVGGSAQETKKAM